MITTLLLIVIVLLLVELFKSKKDKVSRNAIKELAKHINRKVSIYDDGDVFISILDYKKEREDNGCPVSDQLQSVVNIVNKHEESMRALEKHFKFKIICETTAPVPAKREVKVVPEKVEVKKSNRRRK